MKSSVAFLLVLVYSAADGLKCYECMAGDTRLVKNATDRLIVPTEKCFSDWDELPLTECSPLQKYCDILIFEAGDAESIVRSCAVNPIHETGTVEISGVRRSYSSCQTDGCNTAPSVFPGSRTAILLVLLSCIFAL